MRSLRWLCRSQSRTAGSASQAAILRIHGSAADIVLLARPKRAPGLYQPMCLPCSAVEPRTEKPVIAEIAVRRFVVGPAREHSVWMACAVESQIACPASRQNFALDRGAGREHLSQLGRGRCRGSENVVIDNRAVGAVDAATTDKAMIDAVVEVARMMLGGDEVDAVAIVRGIFQS